MRDDFQVELTARSRLDLRSAKDWLSQPGSGRRSHQRYIAILEALVDLRVSPHRWPASEHVGFRRRSIEGYRILYSIDGARRMITVRRVLGPGQDASAI
jgi:mRNA-degrading endonuclease RelE of RelBE toxin-antitoxin system